MSDSATLQAKLKAHGRAIGDAARKGDKGAQSVMRLYQMHYDCPGDPGALGLCSAAIDTWIRERDMNELHTLLLDFGQ